MKLQKRDDKQKSVDSYGQKKKPNIRLYLLSGLIIAVIFAAYRVIISLVEGGSVGGVVYDIMMWTYLSLACVLFVIVIILNRGFSNKPVTADMLPDEWGFDEKRNYIAADTKRKRTAKYLLIPLIAFLAVFIYEIVEIYYAPMLSELFNSISQG